LKEEILDIAKVPIWFAINFSDEEFNKKITWLSNLTDSQYDKITGIVVDSKNFGSGTTFDWEKNKEKLETKALKDKDFILAGGLKEDNVQEAIKILSPDIVDVSSGVEKSKEQIGKDKKLIDNFVKAVRKGTI
nr:hypothetical protein [Lachnospiraceae bacterium]